jgi:ribulose-phosphate 3-epimerase
MYMSLILSPSILNSDFVNLSHEIKMLNASEADWIHLDVMDGIFVPNITIGQPVVEAIRAITKKPLDVHLMIINPYRFVEDFAKAGANILTVHYEACHHLHRTLEQIRSNGMKAGIAINPHTAVNVLEEIIADIDLVLNMTVNPGFGGQKFIDSSYDKIKRLKELILRKNSKALIEVDGGIDLTHSKKLMEAGVDVIVAGTAIFKSKSPAETIRKFKEIS